MVFNRRWEDETEGYIIDHDLTGPPPPPSTGTTQTETGLIVGDAAGISIAPPTPVQVNLPGPKEPVIDSRGVMTPRWYRFLTELYRRTGGPQDNINRVDRDVGGSTTVGSLAITGSTPVVQIAHSKTPSTAALGLTGAAPTVV